MSETIPLTIDTLRADVAAALHETPEDIGYDDNLLDLGLDSMRVLSLVLKWGKSGIALEFSDLAEHTTLNGWWGVVERLQTRAGQQA